MDDLGGGGGGGDDGGGGKFEFTDYYRVVN